MTAFATIVVAGPATVAMIAATAIRRWTPGAVETAAAAALGGTTAALLLDAGVAPTAVPLITLGPAAAVVDIHEGRLPDVLTGAMFATTVPLAMLTGPAGWNGIAVAGIAILALVALKTVSTDSVGWGDVKLTPTVAIVLGQHGATLTGLWCILGLIALTAVTVAARSRTSPVPYGPALVLGPLIAIVLH